MMRRRRPMGTVARTAMVAGTAQAVSGRVAHRQQQRFAQEPAAAPQATAPAPAAPPAGGDEIAELRQLAELHQQGILTDEEFSAKKAQILGI
jgi:hypothetical protein